MAYRGRVLVLVAHPDDESFGCGSTILEAVKCGYQVDVCSASLGETGETADGFELGDRSLAHARHDELCAAAALLGASVLPHLELSDSGWDGEPPAGSICAVSDAELDSRLRAVLDDRTPDVVLMLAGDDGHRDHRRLAAAIPAAVGGRPGVRLYQWCLSRSLMRRWADEVATLRPDTAHLAQELAALGTPPEGVTDSIDTSEHLETRRRAIAAHASQTSPYDGLSAELAEAFLTTDHLARLA